MSSCAVILPWRHICATVPLGLLLLADICSKCLNWKAVLADLGVGMLGDCS